MKVWIENVCRCQTCGKSQASLVADDGWKDDPSTGLCLSCRDKNWVVEPLDFANPVHKMIEESLAVAFTMPIAEAEVVADRLPTWAKETK